MRRRRNAPERSARLEEILVIEQRSIDYIPLAERHGRAWHVTSVWITSSHNLAGFAVGSLGAFLGLNLAWSLLAIAAGALFGTFFAAFHASQGPQLGLPQMIQSRPQYGYQGAILIFLIAIVTFVGFNVAAIVLLGEAGVVLWSGNVDLAMVISTVLAMALAIVGYDLVHRVSRWITVAVVMSVVVLIFVLPLTLDFPSEAVTGGEFSLESFMVLAGAMASATLSWAPYVSDYTRYLPKLGVRAAFVGTYLGMAVSAFVTASIAALASSAFPNLDVVAALDAAGNSIFVGFGHVVLVVAFVGTIVMVTMNIYGAALTTLSIVDTFKPVRHSRLARPVLSAVFGVVSLLLAWQAAASLVTAFTNLLTVLFYLLAPWTATNLIDFFVVRRGVYSIREIFNPAGMYGSWNWRGYTAYVASIVAMLPFTMTYWWTAPLASRIGFDIAPYVGMAVAGLVYVLLYRSADLELEALRVRNCDAGLDATVGADTVNN
jgi:nucleobase:cation symporter-1, NCS1 family